MWLKHRIKSRKLEVKILGIAALLTFTISLNTVTAQESINATGANALGSGGSVNYSVGQFVYQNYSGTNGSVIEGVQQPFEISLVTAIELAKGINLSVTTYPNPTSDYLTLSVNKFDISNLMYQLFDANGQLLQTEKIKNNQTSIIMSNLVSASYFLKVTDGNKELKTFKIIKN